MRVNKKKHKLYNVKIYNKKKNQYFKKKKLLYLNKIKKKRKMKSKK